MKPLLHEITPEQLEKYAWLYVEECLYRTKQIATNAGVIVNLPERQVPTISFFLRIWLPYKKGTTLCRATYYNWLNREEDAATLDTTKNKMRNIEEMFKAVAIDILANDNKGAGMIFYCKNKLGFHDRHEVQNSDVNNLPPITITGMQIL